MDIICHMAGLVTALLKTLLCCQSKHLQASLQHCRGHWIQEQTQLFYIRKNPLLRLAANGHNKAVPLPITKAAHDFQYAVLSIERARSSCSYFCRKGKFWPHSPLNPRKGKSTWCMYIRNSADYLPMGPFIAKPSHHVKFVTRSETRTHTL